MLFSFCFTRKSKVIVEGFDTFCGFNNIYYVSVLKFLLNRDRNKSCRPGASRGSGSVLLKSNFTMGPGIDRTRWILAVVIPRGREKSTTVRTDVRSIPEIVYLTLY